MRFKPLKRLDLILSLSKDEAKISGIFSLLAGFLTSGGFSQSAAEIPPEMRFSP
jgi:hypothetical protein